MKRVVLSRNDGIRRPGTGGEKVLSGPQNVVRKRCFTLLGREISNLTNPGGYTGGNSPILTVIPSLSPCFGLFLPLSTPSQGACNWEKLSERCKTGEKQEE